MKAEYLQRCSAFNFSSCLDKLKNTSLLCPLSTARVSITIMYIDNDYHYLITSIGGELKCIKEQNQPLFWLHSH